MAGRNRRRKSKKNKVGAEKSENTAQNPPAVEGEDGAKGLTPYQGILRTFGFFECPSEGCKAKWSSAHSWRDTWQACKSCKTKVYPYRQRRLELSGRRNEDPNKNHKQGLCGMCISIGRNCSI